MLYDMLLVARPGPTIVKGLQKLIPRAFPSGDTVLEPGGIRAPDRSRFCYHGQVRGGGGGPGGLQLSHCL